MRFSLNWLKEYVELNVSPEEIAQRLTMVGLEVESLQYLGKELEDVIVAQILEIKPHPNASKLVLCDVADGTKRYNIVCGAKNMKAGDKVALARVGTKLPPSVKFPEGVLIQSAKIRGEISEGMLCAENELGLGQEGEGIIILPESAKIGSRLIDALGLNDVIIEIGVTPNRPDCLSVVGIAREVAAILGTKVKYPDYGVSEEKEVPQIPSLPSTEPVVSRVELLRTGLIATPDPEDIRNLASVEVLDSDGCPRYSCRVITDVKIAPSPEWLKTRLEASGIRSINNVVDVTNLVLLELGQPLHAFDYDLIEGKKIVVRSAKEGEVIETLDGVKRTLTHEDLLICDAQRPIALAGVMGGGNTEVSENTKNILIESAYFNPVRIRRTSKKTNLRSESSYRFERGVDPNGVVKALDRASELMRELSGGRVAKGRIDIYPNPIKPKQVKLSPNRLNSILGTNIETEEIKQIIERLEIETLGVKEDEILFKVPTFRVDLTREIDLVEEVARCYGYNGIPTTLGSGAVIKPVLSSSTLLTTGSVEGREGIWGTSSVIQTKAENLKRERLLEDELRDILISSGFLEVINYSFEDPELLSLYNENTPLKVLNPLSKEGSAMRTNLIAGVLRNVGLNLNREIQDIRIFEIGKVYIPREGRKSLVGSRQSFLTIDYQLLTTDYYRGLPKETRMIAGAATGRRQPELWDKAEFDFFDLKGILERVFEAFSLSEKARFKESQTRSELVESLRFLHPGKSARVLIENEELGFLGELHPEFQENLEISKRVYLFEIDLEKLAASLKDTKKKFTPLPKFPAIRRDIALVVDESVPVGEILNEIEKLESPLVEETEVFDVFKGRPVEEGKKSVAVSLTLRAADRTLTDEEANNVLTKALGRLQAAFNAELRKT